MTSCKVCDDGSPPLWQIRARRVIHDQQEQQLYFDEATFQIGNVPVFYLPRLRLPDPTLDRASGFLMPSLYTTSELGTGIKVPYFIKLGDSRDLTLAPYLSGNTKTLELRYRQALRNGDIALTGAVTRDDVRDGSTRAYLFGTGAFNLPKEFKLYFSIEATSDNSYLTQYGYSEKDRLTSELTVSRARRDEYIRGSLYNFESLRENEDNDTQPTLVLDGAYERRFFPAAVGGELRFSLEAHGHRRNSDLSLDGPDPDLIVDGRDVTRLNGKVDWMRRVTTRLGLVADVRGGLAFNFYDIAQDSTFPQNHSELAPDASLALRYPLSRAGAGDVTHLLEPVMQMAYIDGGRLNIPNEESTRVEFDEGNLLSLSRFPRPARAGSGGGSRLQLCAHRPARLGHPCHAGARPAARERSCVFGDLRAAGNHVGLPVGGSDQDRQRLFADRAHAARYRFRHGQGRGTRRLGLRARASGRKLHLAGRRSG